ncbi:hypothetical protein [Roseibium salinum]|uniref:Uncharacterized protein n=1 Tax=Roseibium salinum TaxID=1604349 RepID=A0ABT3R059_9HYPH|nr:hypothetical protein [Roseibium sp. DSM 29163]MCX2722599.1 hypothetical protein [Roseibium sp. DSM 29163]
MKKRIDIEKLLKWAYCDELPKAGAGQGGALLSRSAWSMVEGFGQLLTSVDDNEYGVVPDFGPMDGDPHPDAIKVHAAVCELNALELDLPEGWNPMPEIARHEKHCKIVLDAARFGIANARRRPVDLVRRHAILGGCPDTDGEVPELKPLCNANGQPIWFQMRIEHALDENGEPVEHKWETEDGWNRNTKAPKAGAYQKFYFDPDPTEVIIARGEYQIWRSALSFVVEELRGKLEKWDVVSSDRPACPWENQEWRGPVVLPDLRISA